MNRLFLILFLSLNLSLKAQTPSVAASNIAFSNIGCNEVTVSWSKGNGAERVVFIKKGSPFSQVPVADEFYYDNPRYGLGEEMTPNDNTHFCVYRGIGTSIRITGLTNVTKYYIAIFEYNAAPPKYYYLTTTYASNSFTTENITASFSLSPISQCLNDNKVQFTNTSTSTKSPLSYVWFFNDGNSSTATDPTHTYSKIGIYRVKLVANAPGCTDTTYQNDTIHPHPVAKFDLDPTKFKNDSIQCFYGNRFTFRNSTTLASLGGLFSSTRYEWFMDSGYKATGFKADRGFPYSGVFKIKMVAISNKNCKDSTYQTYVVLPRAIDSTKVIFNPKEMCLTNNLFTFTNNSPLSTSSRWLFGNPGKDSMDGKTATFSYNKVGQYQVTLKAYDARGCLDVFKDSVKVFANTPIDFSGLKSIYCLNEPKSFLVPNPGKGVFIGLNVNSNDSTFTPSNTGPAKVGYVYTKGGCKDTLWKSTEVFNRPSIYLGPDTVICSDKALTLSVDPSYSTSWLPGGQSGSSLQVSSSGTYIANSTEGNCTGSDTIRITAITAPKMSKLVDTTLCGGSYLKFNFRVDQGSAIWSDGNNQKDRVVTQSGFYKVVLANKCGSVSDSFNLVIEETACVIFFPNAFTPNGDFLNDVWLPFGKYEFIRMNVFNRWGELLHSSNTSPEWDGTSNGHLCLDGVYNIVFEYLIQDGNSFSQKTEGIVVHLIR
ncbi:MAG: PKD domain-containing protein [Flavobacteriales bacterium]|nr:PKD domain-containing protein [Flavobacteriales bacterium]